MKANKMRRGEGREGNGRRGRGKEGRKVETEEWKRTYRGSIEDGWMPIGASHPSIDLINSMNMAAKRS